MFRMKATGKIFCFFLNLLLIPSAVCPAAEIPGILQDIWDPNRYISVDEIQPGMDAYCLTCFEGTKVEKFALKVLSVMRDMQPGRDGILVQGTDERFIHTGPVAGCSGSPVYIDGRLAGALAVAWLYSKDPLYGVTPIADMLKVSQVSLPEKKAGQMGFTFDFSKPIDFAEIEKQIKTPYLRRDNSFAGVAPLPCPLITSGLPDKVCEQLADMVEPFGLMVVPGISGGQQKFSEQDIRLEPGSVLIIPLLSGDMTMAVLGTATEVIGDKVYGFGHGYLGYGPVDLPMATGQIHTVVSSVYRSIKLGSMVEVVGALTKDESAAVFGQIGAKARTIPLTITIERYGGAGHRIFNCQLVHNRSLTPMLLSSAVAGAAFYLGDFPPDHMVEYKVAIGVEGAEPIAFENVSTGHGVNEVVTESVGALELLMNNPFKEVNIKSIDFNIREVPKDITSHIWSVDLSDSKVKAGEQIKIEVVIESVLTKKKRYELRLEIPEYLMPGKYELSVCGPTAYGQFLKKAVPYRFMAQSLPSLFEALNNSLRIKRDRLYCILALPTGGVAVERAELPDLPATKALVLQSAKRTLRIQPYQHWLEKSSETGTVVIDKKTMQITVERR